MKVFLTGKRKKEQKGGNSACENDYYREYMKLKKTIKNWHDIFCASEDEKIQQLIRVEILGEPLSRKYAWAIPNEASLNILSNFSPLIEIGCGKGYWSHLLRSRGIDIECFDKISFKKKAWTHVRTGGAEVLTESSNSHRNLFLCYPDENEALAMKCLENFSGTYIIHVGELITTGTLSQPQAAWGRTSTSDFQVALIEEFHCLLVQELPHFPFCKDCISVWKRTEWTTGKGDIDTETDECDVSNDGSDGHTGADLWASIPQDERLPVNVAAPCLAHLLCNGIPPTASHSKKTKRKPLRQMKRLR